MNQVNLGQNQENLEQNQGNLGQNLEETPPLTVLQTVLIPVMTPVAKEEVYSQVLPLTGGGFL